MFLKRFFYIFIVLFTVNFLANLYFYKFPAEKSLIISPLARDIAQKTTSFINSQQNSEGLEKIVKAALKDDNNFGIVIKNLKTGERYYSNEDKTLETASLYKLWVMATAFSQIQNGKLKETDILSKDVQELNKDFNIASDSADLTEGTITWPVQNAIEQMIIISDNYSALLLTEKIGLSNVAAFLENNGLVKSKVGEDVKSPMSTASDIALFLEKLYNGLLANKEYTDKMLDLLKNQQLNGKLPKNLPQDTVIAHKTGELNDISHDAGIVYTPKGDYVIVVMSKAQDSEKTNEKIAEISKEVFGYFENK
jgi:beta-lactamase class A